jgi:putative membrane protein
MSSIKPVPFPKFGVQDEATRMASERTRLAQDRTMLAWVRTATSLITFGFSIHNFRGFEVRGSHSDRFISPTHIAVLMIGIGLVSLLLATVELRRDRKHLKQITPDLPASQAAALAALIAVFGIVALLAVLLRD